MIKHTVMIIMSVENSSCFCENSDTFYFSGLFD